MPTDKDMLNIKLHNGKELVVVKISDKSIKHTIGINNILTCWYNTSDIGEPSDICGNISLPVGSYSLLGRPKELIEEVWSRIVERRFNGYRDYESDFVGIIGWRFDKATASGLSLLKSHGIEDLNNIYLLLKN